MNNCFKYNHNDQYATPSNIYKKIIDMGYIDFNPLCENFENSLLKDFKCNLYCNPPYSNIEPFVDYMIKHYKKGYHVIMLLPSRTGAKWFKKLIDTQNCHIYFFTQRLHFNDSASAPFDCIIIELHISFFNKFGFIDRNLKVL